MSSVAVIQNKRTKFLDALSMKQKGYSIATIAKQLQLEEREVLDLLSDNDYSNKVSLSKIRSAEMAATVAAYDSIIHEMANQIRTSSIEFRDMLDCVKTMQSAIAAKAKILGIDSYVAEKLNEDDVIEMNTELDYSKLTNEELVLYTQLLEKMAK